MNIVVDTVMEHYKMFEQIFTMNDYYVYSTYYMKSEAKVKDITAYDRDDMTTRIRYDILDALRYSQ